MPSYRKDIRTQMVGSCSQEMSFGLLSHWWVSVELGGLAMPFEIPDYS